MELANLNHGSMFQGSLLRGDYVSPALFGLMDQAVSEQESLESLLNYTTTTTYPLLTSLLPTFHDHLSTSTSTGMLDSTMISAATHDHQLNYQDSVLSFDNGFNYSSPSLYPTSSMLCFDHIDSYTTLIGSSDYAVTDPNLVEVMTEDHGLEDQLSLIRHGGIKKRPYTAMDEVQLVKKHCVGFTTKSSKQTTVCKDPQSLAAKNRRERISERLKILQELVPNGTKVDLVTMLEKAISYVKFLQLQVKVLATDEFWPENGGQAPEVGEVREAIDAILSSHNMGNSSSSIPSLF